MRVRLGCAQVAALLTQQQQQREQASLAAAAGGGEAEGGASEAGMENQLLRAQLQAAMQMLEVERAGRQKAELVSTRPSPPPPLQLSVPPFPVARHGQRLLCLRLLFPPPARRPSTLLVPVHPPGAQRAEQLEDRLHGLTRALELRTSATSSSHGGAPAAPLAAATQPGGPLRHVHFHGARDAHGHHAPGAALAAAAGNGKVRLARLRRASTQLIPSPCRGCLLWSRHPPVAHLP